MMTVGEIGAFLEEFAPSQLAEDWDNVGLLVGDPKQRVDKIMTCLTVTPGSVAEAIRQQADLIVTHHPIPFRAVKRLTTETTAGRLLWQVMGAGISVYSPHTAFDSAVAGINQRLAEGLQLAEIQPLVSKADSESAGGAGRWGRLDAAGTVQEVAERLKRFLSVEMLGMVGKPSAPVERVAVACGAAGEFLESARRSGCELLVLGETSFHTLLEAEARGVALLLPGHFASERFAVECLAQVLADQFSGVGVWASRDESDPLRWI